MDQRMAREEARGCGDRDTSRDTSTLMKNPVIAQRSLLKPCEIGFVHWALAIGAFSCRPPSATS